VSATHFEYDPLMCRYFREAGLPRKELAKRCGVRHSRIYVARMQSVRSNNTRKISSGMAHVLDLPELERLELQAETIGHPGDRVLDYFGSHRRVMKRLGVSQPTALELMDVEIL
jgi:transcriptional regulator with XRE-family HTH domain